MLCMMFPSLLIFSSWRRLIVSFHGRFGWALSNQRIFACSLDVQNIPIVYETKSFYSRRMSICLQVCCTPKRKLKVLIVSAYRLDRSWYPRLYCWLFFPFSRIYRDGGRGDWQHRFRWDVGSHYTCGASKSGNNDITSNQKNPDQYEFPTGWKKYR